MELMVRNGNLSWGSMFKLYFFSWIGGFGALFGGAFFLILLLALLSGEVMVNGEPVYGAMQIFLQLMPFLILIPIVIVFHAFFFGGILLFGTWVFSRFRPIAVHLEGN